MLKTSLYVLLFSSFLSLTFAGETDSLFRSEELIRMELRADFTEIENDRNGTAQLHEGKLIYFNKDGSDVMLPVAVSVRGHFRKDPENCIFPPLSISFRKSDVVNTIFRGQGKLKLVTPCQNDEDLIDEYLVYRLYNRVTDLSLKVRLVKIVYYDTAEDSYIFERYSFFLENKKHAAKRNDLVYKDFFLTPFTLDRDNYMKLSVFQYMIGNKDWFITSRHNIIIMQRADGEQNPYAVPYDFDFSGFVNASYTYLPEETQSVSDSRRIFRGLCYTEDEFREVFDFYRELKPEFRTVIKKQKHLSFDSKRHVLKYLKQFYSIIDSRDLFEQEFLAHCETKKSYNIPE